MKATDLPYDVRRQLLSQIREQVGQTNYDRMVNAVGEDGLLDLAIEKAGEVARGQSGAGKKGSYNWLIFVAWATFFVGFPIYALVTSPQTFWGDTLPTLLALILPGIIIGLWDCVKK